MGLALALFVMRSLVGTNLADANSMKHSNQRSSTSREGYAMGYGPMITALYASRRLADEAPFVTPLVGPEDRIIDCGCGPGSMSIDLAVLAPRGQTVGVDIDATQVAMARDAGRARGVPNVDFQVASVYALPFADQSFDLAYVSAVLCNTRYPNRVIAEVKRVTKRAGRVCVRVFDLEDGVLSTPGEPLIERCEELHLRLRRHYGHDPGVGRRSHDLLAGAGLTDIAIERVSHEVTGAGLTGVGEWMANYLLEAWGPNFVEQGWCAKAEVDEMAAAWRRIERCKGARIQHIWYCASAIRS